VGCSIPNDKGDEASSRVTEDEERELRGKLIMAQIEKIEFDTDLARRQERWDLKKFIITTGVSLLIALAAAVGAGVGLGNLIWAHRDQPPQQIIFQPGSIQVPATPTK
jgi:hypothetical protein